jgi:hypothetical protein
VLSKHQNLQKKEKEVMHNQKKKKKEKKGNVALLPYQTLVEKKIIRIF